MTSTIAPHEPDPVPGTAIVRSVDLTGPAGTLDALLNEGAADAPYAALVCHPHPLGGGTMHNKVVYHAMKVMNDPAWGLGWPVLRFNFRGTERSQGVHDGRAESEDVLVALKWLENEYRRPLVLTGFSFGAAMALKACCGRREKQADVRGLIALGLPTEADGHHYKYPFLPDCSLPKLFLSGDRDEFAPAAQLEQIVATAAEPKRLQLVPCADHFFTGHLERMQQALSCWLKEQFT